jgi:hypothetical protein
VPVTDSLGETIDVGDIIMSASKGMVFKIGRVETISEKSGRIGMKLAVEIPIYAYERGAPDIETKGTRIKRDVNGNVVYKGNLPSTSGRYGYSSYREAVYEEYTYFRKDYTKVGSRWKWKKEQAAWSSLLILRKHDSSELKELQKFTNLDYDAFTPELG